MEHNVFESKRETRRIISGYSEIFITRNDRSRKYIPRDASRKRIEVLREKCENMGGGVYAFPDKSATGNR